MTFTTYLLCFLAGLLGIVFHIFAVKIPAVKQAAKVGNIPFTYSAFFQDELAAILASLIMVFIFLIALTEILAYKPDLKNYLIGGFVFVGFTGSSLLVSILGKATAKINAIVDAKTNIADNVKPPDPPPAAV